MGICLVDEAGETFALWRYLEATFAQLLRQTPLASKRLQVQVAPGTRPLSVTADCSYVSLTVATGCDPEPCVAPCGTLIVHSANRRCAVSTLAVFGCSVVSTNVASGNIST